MHEDHHPAELPSRDPVTGHLWGASSESSTRWGPRLDVFEGPLDLLLHLIRQEQVSIYDIPIARITEQYLEFLRRMEEMDLTIASEYLVMAATLIYIKSKMLLPRDPTRPDDGLDHEEDPRRELVARLVEYQKYKTAAEFLRVRAEQEHAVFWRGLIETDRTNPEVNATLFDLFRAFHRAMERVRQQREVIIAREEITMAQKIAELRAQLQDTDRLDITALFEAARTRREVVILFLAVLELARIAWIRLVQRERFGRILAIRTESSADLWIGWGAPTGPPREGTSRGLQPIEGNAETER